jgi:hypothetical protein
MMNDILQIIAQKGHNSIGIGYSALSSLLDKVSLFIILKI